MPGAEWRLPLPPSSDRHARSGRPRMAAEALVLDRDHRRPHRAKFAQRGSQREARPERNQRFARWRRGHRSSARSEQRTSPSRKKGGREGEGGNQLQGERRLPVPPRPHVTKIRRRGGRRDWQGGASSQAPQAAQWRPQGFLTARAGRRARVIDRSSPPGGTLTSALLKLALAPGARVRAGGAMVQR